MNYVELQPGTRVSIAPKGGDLGAVYEATVRSVTEHAVRLTMPEREHEFLNVEPGESITMFLSRQGQVYRITSRVRLIETSPVEGLVIDPPAEAVKNERRSYYRLLTRIVPRYAAVVGRGGAEEPLGENVILDISGGGLQMQSKSRIEAGARLHLVFAVDGDPLEIEVLVDVLTVHPPVNGGRVYRFHGRFAGVPRSEVERIIRYIYREQLELRRKGVL
jgi:c-di-GMP-binding flagellar brake protein YcgR